MGWWKIEEKDDKNQGTILEGRKTKTKCVGKRKTGVRKTSALVKRLKKKEEEREIRERARRREKKRYDSAALLMSSLSSTSSQQRRVNEDMNKACTAVHVSSLRATAVYVSSECVADKNTLKQFWKITSFTAVSLLTALFVLSTRVHVCVCRWRGLKLCS